MLRLLYILLFVFCYSVADVSSLPLVEQSVESESVAVCDDNISTSQPFDKHNYDESQSVMPMPRAA